MASEDVPAGQRRRFKQQRSPDEYRTEYERDSDRILYSSAFRRLAAVTQVAAVSERRLLHNRLTHSLKVGQIGRRMAERLLRMAKNGSAPSTLRDLDPEVVEAAGLAHDLGHPPFGHIAEKVLDQKLAEYGGFEGNAQSFRILAKLGVRNDSLGLDLTRATLNGVLKYPTFRPDDGQPAPERSAQSPHWSDRSKGSKWGVYDTERQDFVFARNGDATETRSVEAILMDWADDVSYATHDLDDYFRAGLIPLHDLARDSDRFVAYAIDKIRQSNDRTHGFDPARFAHSWSGIMREISDVPIKHPFTGLRSDRTKLHDVVSAAISRYVNEVQVLDWAPYVRIPEQVQYEVEALKKLTWYYVIDNPGLASLQHGQMVLIGTIFDRFVDWLNDPMSPRRPQAMRELFLGAQEDPEMAHLSNEAIRARVACDYICSLTEDQALDMYERMSGSSRESIFGAWF